MRKWTTNNGDQIYRHGKRVSGSAVVLHIQDLQEKLDEARKMACDSCSSGVPLQPDGYHRDATGELRWCDAQIAEGPT